MLPFALIAFPLSAPRMVAFFSRSFSFRLSFFSRLRRARFSFSASSAALFATVDLRISILFLLLGFFFLALDVDVAVDIVVAVKSFDCLAAVAEARVICFTRQGYWQPG